MYPIRFNARRTCSSLGRKSVDRLTARPLFSVNPLRPTSLRVSRQGQYLRCGAIRCVSSTTEARVVEQEQDWKNEDDMVDSLMSRFNVDGGLPDNLDRLKRSVVVEDAIHLENRVRRHEQIDLHQYWSVNYRLLRWLHDDHPDVERALAFHIERALDFIGPPIGSYKSMVRRKWRQTCDKGEVANLLSVLIGCLAHSAEATLKVLRGVPESRFYSWFFIFPERADILFRLRCDCWEEIQADPDLTQIFWDEVNKLRQVSGWPGWPARPFNSRYLDLLLQNITVEEQQTVVSAYLARYTNLHDAALLYLVDCYTKWEDVDTALSMLRKMSPEGLQQRSDVAPRCMNLLELETVQRDGESHAFKVLPAILELGFIPDDLIYDIATQNSVHFELPAVAWDIFRHAKGQGAFIGPRAHQMLLKDSYLRRDTNALNEILSIIEESPELYQNPGINACMVNIVRGICIYERGSGPAESLARILAVYDKAYSRAPLARSGIIPEIQIDEGNPELPEPEALSLAFMIFSYVMIQRDEVAVTRFWDRLTAKMGRGDRDVLAAARHSVMYAGFICFYSKNRETISRALSVLRYMLVSERCLPGDIEWSMVIGMFLRHGKSESAEKVRQLMLQRGVPVTEAAWRHNLLMYPHTEVAQEVKKILGLGPESDVRDGRLVEFPKDGTGSESSNGIPSSIDVTKQQSDSYSSEVEPNPAWARADGLESTLHFGEKETRA